MNWDFLDYRFAGVAVWRYLAVLAAIVGGFILKRVADLILGLLHRRIKPGSKRLTFRLIIGTIERPLPWLFLVLGLAVALDFLPLPRKPINLEHFCNALIDTLYTILIIWALVRLIDTISGVWTERTKKTPGKLDDQIIPIARKSLKIFAIVIGAVIIIQRLGYSAESLIAGLGISSLAVAFAAKDTVANLFGSLVIFIDRPFQVGDWVEIENNEGTVEEVNLRTTRLRTFSNSLITIPNQKLTVTSIINWSAMGKRRVKTTIPLSRKCSAAQLRQAIKEISLLLCADEFIHQDQIVVNLTSIEQSSFGILLCFHSKQVRWGDYLRHQEAILLGIIERMEELGIEISLPSQEIKIIESSSEPIKQ